MKTDVWQLENQKQIVASEDLNWIIETALAGDRKLQNYLKKLWGNSWQTIKERVNTEGSVWYVWYMDGVDQHIINGKGSHLWTGSYEPDLA